MASITGNISTVKNMIWFKMNNIGTEEFLWMDALICAPVVAKCFGVKVVLCHEGETCCVHDDTDHTNAITMEHAPIVEIVFNDQHHVAMLVIIMIMIKCIMASCW